MTPQPRVSEGEIRDANNEALAMDLNHAVHRDRCVHRRPGGGPARPERVGGKLAKDLGYANLGAVMKSVKATDNGMEKVTASGRSEKVDKVSKPDKPDKPEKPTKMKSPSDLKRRGASRIGTGMGQEGA